MRILLKSTAAAAAATAYSTYLAFNEHPKYNNYTNNTQSMNKYLREKIPSGVVTTFVEYA